ncbi:MAG: hypothetical protein AB7R69_02120 [Candidatus Babeliales bacterium]
MNKKIFSLSALVTSLIVLSSCDWGKKEEVKKETSSTAQESTAAPTGEVLLTINGKPAITTSQFEEYKNSVLDAQPQLRQLMAFMPDAEMELFKSMANEIMLKNWIEKHGIDKRADYQKDRRMGQEFLDRQLAIKYFQQEYPKMAKVEVTDAEARKIYDEKKETTPELMISQGGITIELVEFKQEAPAKEFFEKVKEAGKDFMQVAKDAQLKPKEIKGVNGQSFEVDGAVREKVTKMSRLPATELIKGKDKFFVVRAVVKDEAKYVPFEQDKEPIKQQLKAQKLFTEELDKLRKDFDIQENNAFFEKQKQARQEELERMKEEAQKQMQKKQAQTTEKSDNPVVAQNSQKAAVVKGA